MKNLIITGGAGFIGSNLIEHLLNVGGYRITCIDNFDDFYSIHQKQKNIEFFVNNPNFRLIHSDVRDYHFLVEQLTEKYDGIIHLAAKAGVRPSLLKPMEYVSVNVEGTQSILEIARNKKIPRFIFASSSSVYGTCPNIPWEETECELNPISPYAASKISGEQLGKVYSNIYDMQFFALRFFTVYGPRQRPDLAINKFIKTIINEETINCYGDGNTKRDYTFVSDIVIGIKSAIDLEIESKFEVFNLGNSYPVTLIDLIRNIEKILDKKAIIKWLPEQKGDVPLTLANIQKANKILNYNPKTNLEVGLKLYYDWWYGNT